MKKSCFIIAVIVNLLKSKNSPVRSVSYNSAIHTDLFPKNIL